MFLIHCRLDVFTIFWRAYKSKTFWKLIFFFFFTPFYILWSHTIPQLTSDDPLFNCFPNDPSLPMSPICRSPTTVHWKINQSEERDKKRNRNLIYLSNIFGIKLTPSSKTRDFRIRNDFLIIIFRRLHAKPKPDGFEWMLCSNVRLINTTAPTDLFKLQVLGICGRGTRCEMWDPRSSWGRCASLCGSAGSIDDTSFAGIDIFVKCVKLR